MTIEWLNKMRNLFLYSLDNWNTISYHDRESDLIFIQLIDAEIARQEPCERIIITDEFDHWDNGPTICKYLACPKCKTGVDSHDYFCKNCGIKFC